MFGMKCRKFLGCLHRGKHRLGSRHTQMLSAGVGLRWSEVLYLGNAKCFIHQKKTVTVPPSVLTVSVNSVAPDQSREG